MSKTSTRSKIEVLKMWLQSINPVKYIKTTHDVLGGDSNTSKGILLPLKDFF